MRYVYIYTLTYLYICMQCMHIYIYIDIATGDSMFRGIPTSTLHLPLLFMGPVFWVTKLGWLGADPTFSAQPERLVDYVGQDPVVALDSRSVLKVKLPPGEGSQFWFLAFFVRKSLLENTSWNCYWSEITRYFWLYSHWMVVLDLIGLY